jgi:hypothetical protein
MPDKKACPWSVRSTCVWAAVAVLVALSGCGGHHPGGPSDVPGAGFTRSVTSGSNETAILVRDGVDGGPVAGAHVDVSGTTLTTDAAGRVLGAFAAGTPLRVTANGTLVRETVAGQGHDIALWPEGLVVPRDDTYDLVYKDSPGQQLTRVQASSVALRLSPAIAGDAEARSTIAEAALRISDASGVAYRVETAPAPGEVVFDVTLDPNLPGEVLGHTVVRSRGGVVTGGQVSFHNLASARRLNTTLHELAHCLGLLGHSQNPHNVLYASASEVTDFSPAERAIMTMMRQRRPGNRFPDTDAGMGAASAVTAVTHATEGGAR